MAPQRRNKSSSSRSESSIGPDAFPTPPRVVPVKSGMTPSRTPHRVQGGRVVRITIAQKQALIDNLQLEITERARKLRAQYALRTQGLKSRLEMRIHRIPAGLRTMTMADLLERQARKEREAVRQKKELAEAPKQPVEPANPPSQASTTVQSRPATSGSQTQKKRKSDDLEGDADKENATVANPRKRSRAAPGPASTATSQKAGSRAASGKAAGAGARQVLSPKSHNSRTLQASPFKPAGAGASPQKSNIARPVSPLKPATGTLPRGKPVAKPKAKGDTSRAASRQAQTTGTTRSRVNKTAEDAQNSETGNGRTSSASDKTAASSGTTIVKRAASKTAGPARPAAEGKKPGTVKRLVAGLESKKKETVPSARGKKAEPAAATGGRTLRKRT